MTLGDAEIKTVANFQIRDRIVIPGPGDVFIIFTEPRVMEIEKSWISKIENLKSKAEIEIYLVNSYLILSISKYRLPITEVDNFERSRPEFGRPRAPVQVTAGGQQRRREGHQDDRQQQLQPRLGGRRERAAGDGARGRGLVSRPPHLPGQ